MATPYEDLVSILNEFKASGVPFVTRKDVLAALLKRRDGRMPALSSFLFERATEAVGARYKAKSPVCRESAILFNQT